MRTLAGVGVLAPLTFTTIDAAAQEAEGPRHRGFFMRMALGIGGADAGNDGPPEIEFGGAAGLGSFDIGGSLAERLALHVRFSAHTMVDPTVSVNGEALGEADDTTLTFSSLGLGLTYYFPSNLYLTGVLGLCGATAEVAGEEIESDTGIAIGADLGYEWWAGGDWGLGVAGRLEFDSIPDDPDRLVAVALGVLFSATYH